MLSGNVFGNFGITDLCVTVVACLGIKSVSVVPVGVFCIGKSRHNGFTHFGCSHEQFESGTLCVSVPLLPEEPFSPGAPGNPGDPDIPGGPCIPGGPIGPGFPCGPGGPGSPGHNTMIFFLGFVFADGFGVVMGGGALVVEITSSE